jgi:TIR domain
MKIFLAYASQDLLIAKSVVHSLRGRRHKVFFDRDDLPPGESYDQQIERAINRSDIFVFLISPDSVAEDCYTITELRFARRKWPNPNGHVLPVMVRKTQLDDVDPYLKSVTIVPFEGNMVASTSAAVDMMRRSPWRMIAAFVGIVAVVTLIIVFFRPMPSLWPVPLNGCGDKPHLHGTWGTRSEVSEGQWIYDVYLNENSISASYVSDKPGEQRPDPNQPGDSKSAKIRTYLCDGVNFLMAEENSSNNMNCTYSGTLMGDEVRGAYYCPLLKFGGPRIGEFRFEFQPR